MKTKILFIVFILTCQIFAIDGELFFKIIQQNIWRLEFKSISDQKYYDCNFNLLSGSTNLDFTFTGPNLIKWPGNIIGADHCCDLVGEGVLDDNNRRFAYYYGKYEVTFTWVESLQHITFYMDFKDCNYFQRGSPFPYDDIFFRIENQQFIETNSAFAINWGNYTGQSYEIWNDFQIITPRIPVTTCFSKDVVVRNLVLGSDYGSLSVNGIPKISGTPVNLNQGYNTFETYTQLVQTDQKFRNWNRTENEFINPTDLWISGSSPVIGTFFQTHPLTVTNNLEGGTGGNYNLTWINSSQPEFALPYGTAYNAFKNQDPTFDRYRIEAPALTSILGTSWNFQYWNDGSTNSVKSNVPIDGPTTFTAYYKGNLRSNTSSAYNPTQRKFARLNNGKYHTYYESMNKIWGTASSESGYTGQWDEEADILSVLQLPSTAKAKNVSLDIILDTTYIVFEYLESDASMNAQIYYAKFPFNTEDKILIDSYPATYFGQAKPVLARFIQSGGNVDEIYVLYRKNNTDGIYFKRKYYNLNTQYYWETGILPNTNSYCLNPALVPIHNSSFTPIHIVWQQADQIRYIYSSTYPARNYSLYSTTPISSGCGYPYNYSPSISIAGNNNTIVASWSADNGMRLPKTFGKEEARVAYKSVTRVNQNNVWGNFFIAGDNVINTTNNSTSSSTSESVIAWSENSGANAKWVRRVGTEYSCLFSLNPAGLVPVICNAPDLISTKALVFNQSTLPYVIEKSTTNFTLACEGGGGGGDLGKINIEDGTLYGRRGIVMKNGVEFIFNIGDVVADDSVINFVPRPDTIVYSAYSELNEVVKTIPFQLNQNSSFQFSNLYYTLYGELADTALTENDAVTFRVELVNNVTQNVVGTFDNITYDKNNLEKYENISYQVNCSGIQPGEYYLRLVTTVAGNAEYNLANVQTATTNLEKKLFTTIYFDGNGLPENYDISQNYPNPFNPTTVINYQIPKDGLVTIKVYDILGKEVTTLVNENKSIGRYTVQFNGNDLASGVYIYQLRSGDFVSSKKMLMIK